jgi:choline dehydrogenase-like flavoprotein
MSAEMDADIIVVGAGILGALAAERIAARGKSVLILEAGPRLPRWQLLESFRNGPNKGSADAFYPELPYAPKGGGGRYSDDYLDNVGPMVWKPSVLRLVGGTTWHWSSAFWRYVPNDFKLHSRYGVGRDWPIDYDQLEPWYTLAEQITGCSGSDTDDQGGGGGKPFPPRSAPYPLPPLARSSYIQAVAARMTALGFNFIEEPHLRASRPYGGRPTCSGNSNCTPLCPIGAMFTGDMAVALAERAGARVLPDTVAYRLEKGAGGKIAAVHTKAPDGRSTRRTARYFVLAAHALETPKLMLMSEVGNSSDQVGRNLMSHPSLIWEGLVKEALWPGRGPSQQGSVNERRDGPERAHSAAFKYIFNSNVPNLALTRRLLQQGIMGRELDERIRHDCARFVSIVAGMEQLPVAGNRVSLSDRRDALGLPTPRIYMDVDEYTRRAGAVAARDFARIGRAFELQQPLGDPKAWRLAAHIMGTTIMGSDPGTSVVNAECRAHDHDNLFVASTAVFASSSTVNPTLTGAALSLRLGAQIAAEV